MAQLPPWLLAAQQAALQSPEVTAKMQEQANQVAQGQVPPMLQADPSRMPAEQSAAPDLKSKQVMQPLQGAEGLETYLPRRHDAEEEIFQAYGKNAKEAMAAQGSDLSMLNDYINTIAQKPTGINWTPLAAYLDSNMPGSKMTAAAQAMAPMSDQDKDKMLFDLRAKLASGRASLSAENLKALGQQMESLRNRSRDAESMRHNRATEENGDTRAQAMGIRGQVAQDNQGFALVNKIHNNPDLVGMRRQAVNIDKGLHLLDGTPSNKALAEVAQDFSAALSGKAASSDFKLKELMTPSFQQQVADMKAYMSANPDQPAPPHVVAFWKNMGTRLNDAYNHQMQARAQGLLVGLKTAAKHNPNAYVSAKEAADLYNDGGWRTLEGMTPMGNGSRPATIIQDGHTFTLNPATGEYE